MFSSCCVMRIPTDMIMFKELWKIVLLVSVPYIADANPSCKWHDDLQRDIICTPGHSDYVLRRGLVSDNNRTTGITLSGCRIIDVDYEAFKGDHSLQYLDLSRNAIQYLKLGVLDENHDVRSLNLSYNLLKELPLGLFDQKPNLEVLDLKSNKIENIQKGMFDPFSKLKHLDLSGNLILGRSLDPDLFNYSRKIHFMDFSRNDMSGTPKKLLQSFEEIDFLNLDRCFLTEVPDFVRISNLKSMKHLMLSSNQISSLENANTFGNLDNLEILNLAENVIELVNENVFKPLKSLKMIILRNNKIKELPETLFHNIPKLGNIDLSHNLIEYVPVNAFRGTSLKNLNLAINRFSYLQDNFCLELRNSGARLTKFFFNQNPWQCACLKELLKEVKSFGVEYNRVKYNGEEPVCVTTKEFNCKRHQNFNEIYLEMYDNLISSLML